jgi:hypothetical protein
MKVVDWNKKHQIRSLLPVTDLFIEVLDGAIKKKEPKERTATDAKRAHQKTLIR